ncbi:MAG: hypothetical protein WC686_00535 [Candidatus Shapirobacteria bacterium]|jgi:hypothetical protein
MKKSKLSSYLITFSVITFLTIFFLIAENSYSKMVGPIKIAQANNLMTPVDPNLDSDVVLQIENRDEFVSDDQVVISSLPAND